MSASLLDLKTVMADEAARIFALADRLSGEKPADRDYFRHRRGLTVALVFFEPSTRTRMSFEIAAQREGVAPIRLDGGAGTSLEKGETPEDTLLNIAAMQPSVVVVRSGDSLDQAAMAKTLKMPLINAGWGRRGHPTQALLDAYTIRRLRGGFHGQRVLLIGDIRHSRVAASHFELAPLLGYELALCGPADFLPEQTTLPVFTDLREGLKWSTVAMALRVQLERHPNAPDLRDYHQRWGLHASTLEALSPQSLIMHPGPVNWGTELAPEIAKDRRTVILDQVTSGVLIRQVLLRRALGEI